MDEWNDLPPEIQDSIRKDRAEGVSFHFVIDPDLPHGTQWRNRRLHMITWRPGDPNPLAEAIIDRVRERAELNLDGHKYWIEPQEDQ